MTAWKPRSSSMGYYLACDYRAAFDRAVHEGLMALPQAVVDDQAKPKPSADLGTCIHWYMQDSMRCVFPTGDPLTHKFTQAQLDCAASLFGHDIDSTLTVIQKVAQMAIPEMPPTPDGKPWLAETEFTDERIQVIGCSGHIDFLSQDGSTIVDLKTTAKKPLYGRIKPEHLVQQIVYGLLVGEPIRRCHVLYASSRGDWVCLSRPFEFTTEDGARFVEHVREYIQYLIGDQLMVRAVPRIGVHCYESWCPYTALCRDAIIPPAAPVKAGPGRADGKPPTFASLF